MDISEIIGENLKQLRSERKLSLGRLSAQSGVSKVMLSQIEKGASNPSINTVWKIADALQLPYTALLERQMSGGTTISLKDIPSQKLDDDCGSLRCYYHHTNGRDFELFHMHIRPDGTHSSQGHGERTEEYALVICGTLTITLDDGEHILHEGDAINFPSDKPHTYHNNGKDALELVIINHYR